jgi:hypothetical protein
VNTYDNDYEGVRRVVYGEGWTFVPVCEKCGRFVKADKTIKVSEISGLKGASNARCRKCGRTMMIFEGCF